MTRVTLIFLQLLLFATGIGAQKAATNPGVTVQAGIEISEATRAHVQNLADEGLKTLVPRIPGTPKAPIQLFVHRSADEVPERVRSAFHPGTAGIALRGRNEIHIVLDESRRSPPNDLRTVVDHELVHILLDQHVGRARYHVSRWFHEGLAQVLSGGRYIGMSEEDLVLTVRAERLLPFDSLHRDFPRDRSSLRRAYAQSFSFVGFLERRYGLPMLLHCAATSGAKRGFREGFYAETRTPIALVEDDWREYVVHGSGAALRLVLENCFSYVMILAVVLLSLAGMRRWRRDEQIRKKLELEERLDDAATEAALHELDPPPREQ